MTVSVHNPDQYMAALRTIIAQGRKRIGLLVGAGSSAGMARPDGTYPLIPAVAGLTDQVLTTLAPTYQQQIDGLKAELAQHCPSSGHLAQIGAYISGERASSGG